MLDGKGFMMDLLQNVVKKFIKLGSKPGKHFSLILVLQLVLVTIMLEERVNMFKEKYPFLNKNFYKKRFGVYYLNLWEIAKLILLNEGFKNKNIEISKICTYCHKNLFSHRKEKNKGEKPGIIFALFALRG
jgi:copper oxidase (laccase) domain-containing protein